jgi:N-acetylmuramoyl-L-alanine amidase
VGDAYTQMNEISLIKMDLRSAIETYEKLIRLYPNSNLADDAAFFIGRIYEEKLQAPAKAYKAYARCCTFPKGDMGKKAVVAKTRLAKYANIPTPTPTPTPPPAQTPEPKTDAMVFPVEALGMNVLDKVEVWSNPDYTRIVIYTNKETKFESHLLKADPDHHKPRRLFLDFDQTVLRPDQKSDIPIGDGLLKQVRVGQYQTDVVRVVLDIQSIQTHRVFPMFEPFRVVIDVTGHKKTPPPVQGAKIRRIVLDPGHGGKDPGAMAGGSKEKLLVNTLAKKTAAQLRAMGFEVLISRKGDRFISLESRTALANKYDADLFVSIHVNANRSSRPMGIETFHFAPRASKEDIALVAKENKTAQAKVQQMNRILTGIELGYKKMESNVLATNVQREMLKLITPYYRGTVNRGVKSAPFYVLMGANMPAILVECGFITNATERKRLNHIPYQNRLAKGIATGVAAYVKELDPQWKPKKTPGKK